MFNIFWDITRTVFKAAFAVIGFIICLVLGSLPD